MARMGGTKRFRSTPNSPQGDGDSVNVHNRYQLLSEVNLGEEEYNGQPGRSRGSRSTIPPIIIDGQLKEHKKVTSELKAVLKEEFAVKVSRGGKTILRVSNADDHRNAVKYLEKKYQFHSFSLKEDFQPNWVVRGLPKSVTEDEIKEELALKGLTVIRMKMISKEETEYPSYSVTFDKTTVIKSILEVKRLCYCVVTWSKYKSTKEVTQCYKCMGFGHISTNCHHLEKCMKCSGTHPIKECEVEEMLCANCGNQHMANDKTCEIYKSNVDKKKQSLRPVSRKLAQGRSVTSNNTRDKFPSLSQNTQPQRVSIPPDGASFAQATRQSTSVNITRPTSSERSHEQERSTFSEIKDLLKLINVPKIMLFLSIISQQLKNSDGDVFSKIMLVVESVFQCFDG